MIDENYFNLFALPARFEIDREALENAWRLAAARTHPDQFALATPAERQIVMQWAAYINEAHTCLRHPLLRAAYLCQQAGVQTHAEPAPILDSVFLSQQWTWREMLDQACIGHTTQAFDCLEAQLQQAWNELQIKLADLIDQQHDYLSANIRIHEGFFIEKLMQEVARLRPSCLISH